MRNKPVLLSIKPEWANLIYSGQKKLEWRKTRPSNYKIPLSLRYPFTVYLYETAPIKRITGYFICNAIIRIYSDQAILFNNEMQGCISSEDLIKYIGDKRQLYAWEITKSVKFNRPYQLYKRPPQSWQYFYFNLDTKNDYGI